MKRCVTLLLMLVSFAVARAEKIEYVDSAAGLKEAVESNPEAYIKLTADIDLSKIKTISTTFRGTIDGEGVKIIDGKEETVFYSLGNGKNRVYHPVFKAMEGATLKNLVIQYFRIEWDDDDIGAVASTAKNCNFNQVILSDISIFNDDDDAGAIVGKAENCDFRNVKCMGNDVTVDGNRAGGFVGLSVNSIYCNCSNSAYSTVYADGSWGNAYAGGFVGESKSDQFVFCVNFASVGALDDRVGGLVGYGTQSIFTNCVNSGAVMHCEENVFINHTRGMKDELEKELQDIYDKQNFDLSVGFASFIGTLGLSAASFGVELCLLSVTTAGIGAFTVTVIIAATGITMSLISLIDAELGAHDEIGGICGACEGSAFNTCSNYGNLWCRDCYVGGIVGYVRDMPTRSVITDCLNAGKIRGYEKVGGIFGQCNLADRVSNCLNVGNVVAEQDDTQSDPIGHVSGYDGIVSNLSDNYYRSNRYDEDAVARIPVTDELLGNGMVANYLNGDAGSSGPWRQGSGDAYPVLDPSQEEVNLRELSDVYLISTLDDLNRLRNDVNSGAKDNYIVYFEEDIDCSAVTWVPIGTYEHPFVGYCNGEGHTISHLTTADNKEKNGVGFIGVAGLKAEVYNLVIESGSITGGNGVGAIIGYAEHKTNTEGYIRIEGCGNGAAINGNYDCGGLIGAIYSDNLLKLSIENCYNVGNVTAGSKSAALCGYAKHGATIRGCWNAGSVTGTEDGMGFARGENDILVQNCHSYLTDLGQTAGVTEFSDEDLKDGTLCFRVNGWSNEASVGLPWEQDITCDVYPRYVGYRNDKNAVCSSRTITGNYGTVVLPYSVKSDDYIRYYQFVGTNADGTQLDFTATELLEAGTPAIFRVTKPDTLYRFVSADYVFEYSVNPIDMIDWKMNGNLSVENMVFDDSEELKSLYYISDGEIKSAKNKLTVAPFRAYLSGPARLEGSMARTMGISLGDGSDTTGLRLVPVETREDGSTVMGIYNLSGQRLDAPGQGIVIINGEKVLNK